MSELICWICNKYDANSGEHVVKRSDLELHLGEISRANPLYRLKMDGSEGKKIYSSKNNSFKYSKTICEYCNQTLTQPHDTAWEELSRHFHSEFIRLRNKGKWNPKSVFDNCKKRMLDVHLFFLKNFGCLIKEFGYDEYIDLYELSDSILNSYSNSYFFLAFGFDETGKYKLRGTISGKPIIKSLEGKVVCTHYYNVGLMVVILLYSKRYRPTNFWHPDDSENLIPFQNFGHRL
ncbi:hypothetical protein [Marinicella sp. W31]|uniref:hypothetical protein n=1 Tax=Marinicella sp. W31 TaxID=3023713 RepID=UPI003757EB3A